MLQARAEKKLFVIRSGGVYRARETGDKAYREEVGKYRFSFYLVWFRVPHCLHFLSSSLFANRSIIGFSCVPRSVQWKDS